MIEELREIASSDAERQLLGDKIKELGWSKGPLASLASKLLGSKQSAKPGPNEAETPPG